MANKSMEIITTSDGATGNLTADDKPDCAPRTCSASAEEIEELYQMVSNIRTMIDCQCWGSTAYKARELMRASRKLLDRQMAQPTPNAELKHGANNP